LEVLTKSDAKLWLNRIKVSRNFYKENLYTRAKEMVRMYVGEHFSGLEAEVAVVINYCFAIIKAILPQIYYQDPYIFLTPGDGDTKEENSKAAEVIVNFFWGNMGIKKQIKKIVLDTLLYSYGIGKLGYTTKTKKTGFAESGAAHTELITAEFPFFIRTSPLDVVTDTYIKDFDKKRWIATRYVLPLSEMKEKYKNTKDLKGSYKVKSADDQTLKNLGIPGTELEDFKFVEFWEALDVVDNKIYVVTEETDKFLREESSAYDIKGGNYKFLIFNDVPDRLFPLSDLSQIAKINIEIDKTRSQLLHHRAKSQRKIFYDQDIFANEKEKKNFKSDADMVMVACKPGKVKDGVKIFDPSMVQAELYNIDALSKDDLNNISAVGYQQRAVEALVEKTATESRIIDRAANLRNSERLDAVTDFCIDVAKGIITILQKNLTEKTAVKITKEGKERFEKFNKESISGKHNVRIDVGSMAKPDTDEDRMRINEFAQTAIGAVDEKGRAVVNQRGLIEVLIKKYKFTEDEIEKILRIQKLKEEKKRGTIREPSLEEIAFVLEQMGMGQPPPTGMMPAGMGGMPPGFPGGY